MQSRIWQTRAHVVQGSAAISGNLCAVATEGVVLMDGARPVFNQINLVVHDMHEMVEFYERLGVAIAPSIEPWDRHHRNITADEGIDFDLDSTSFAAQWNEGWPAGKVGAVLGFRLESPEAVDATYADLTSAGYAGQQPPYDGFMGARYAVVADPDGNSVGLMSPRDLTRATIPPPPPD
jgi:catechol 2,3-dioxygenase-like lactoylglutathione lyase family enzyme